MAAQPKKKISRVRGRTRRAHQAVPLARLVACPNCKHQKPPHIACPECGFYGAKKIITTKTDKRIAKQLKTEQKSQGDTEKEKKPATKPTKSRKQSSTAKKSPKKSDSKTESKPKKESDDK